MSDCEIRDAAETSSVGVEVQAYPQTFCRKFGQNLNKFGQKSFDIF